STNNGTSWTVDTAGMGYQDILSFAVSGSNIFAGTYDFGVAYGGGGVYLSTNNGTSWTLDTAGMGYQYIFSFAMSGSNIFAGTGGGVYLSTNNGTSWTLDTNGMGGYQEVSSLAAGDSNILAG